MYGITTQVSLYPLRQDDLSPSIDAMVETFARHGLERQTGSMSTLVWDDDEKVFPALIDAFRGAAAKGHTVMVITVSNACPWPGKSVGLGNRQPGTLARGGLPQPLRSRPCDRSLPVPLDAISASLHRPPASRGPLPKRPSTERIDAPHPARRPTEAYPPRYGEGGQRSRGGCSGPRMPGSEGMVPWAPGIPRIA